MKSLKKQRRVQIIAIATVALVLSTGLIGYALQDGINFFRSPSNVVAEPPAPTETFRLGGVVEAGSLVRGDGETVSFKIADCITAIPVKYTGVLPDLFKENDDAIAQGSMVNGTFVATEVLAKHDEEYTPKEISDVREEQQAHCEPDGS